MNDRVDLLLRDGRLEQMCPDCGRWEAAHPYCSWCQRPMTRADWYLNHDLEERHSRMPKVAPADPPVEYRAGRENWPIGWGPWPYGDRSPRHPQTPPKRASKAGGGGQYHSRAARGKKDEVAAETTDGPTPTAALTALAEALEARRG